MLKIQSQNAYCDNDSHEKRTGVRKRKYKLAGNIINELRVCTFFITTSHRYLCEKGLAVEIRHRDWENLIQGYLSGESSYVDVLKVETMSESDLLNKMNDPTNGFLCVARLSDAKYQELKELRSNAHRSRRHVPLERQALARVALDDVVDLGGFNEELLVKLGL